MKVIHQRRIPVDALPNYAWTETHMTTAASPASATLRTKPDSSHQRGHAPQKKNRHRAVRPGGESLAIQLSNTGLRFDLKHGAGAVTPSRGGRAEDVPVDENDSRTRIISIAADGVERPKQTLLITAA
jgi:hypothetical protein